MQNTKLFFYKVLTFCLIIICIISCQQENQVSEELSINIYSQYWTSGIPSKMKIVAEAATNLGSSNAELAISRDIYSGNKRNGVNSEFLKLVYSPLWEAELTKSDRKTALALGLSNLLGTKVKFNISQTNHPALFYSILASSDLNILKTSFLSAYSTLKLANLVNVGKRYTVLNNFGVKSLSHPLSWSVAKFSIGSFTRESLFTFFYGAKDLSQLKARLSLFLSLDYNINQTSLNEIEKILANKHKTFKSDIAWINQGKIVNWKVFSPIQKLRLYSSRFPSDELNIEYLADLLTSPDKAIALKAKVKLKELLPSEKETSTFSFLIEKKAKLTRSSIIFLVSIFKESNQKKAPLLREWFNLKPKPSLIIDLIASRTKLDSDILVTEGILYLQSQKYQVKASMLDKLINHSDPFVRAYAYSHLNPLIDEHKDLIKYLINVENDQSLLRQLSEKLKIL
jgi:hypothetical protein